MHSFSKRQRQDNAATKLFHRQKQVTETNTKRDKDRIQSKQGLVINDVCDKNWTKPRHLGTTGNYTITRKEKGITLCSTKFRFPNTRAT